MFGGGKNIGELTGVNDKGHCLPVDQEEREGERLEGQAENGEDPVEQGDEDDALLVVEAEEALDPEVIEAAEHLSVAAYHFFFLTGRV